MTCYQWNIHLRGCRGIAYIPRYAYRFSRRVLALYLVLQTEGLLFRFCIAKEMQDEARSTVLRAFYRARSADASR